ncbi:ATP-binding protein [Fuscovulum ytuae]|uniref:histidine kinase n=1 Tax=Fuscovulum ytuae TaxID=3042299 RepID=A0ABY8QCX2_9RHOB|nr:ATP-binding protein [Fuscovulum sp. YMD61]WGV18311.1 ATP-binding protein [Fuscovulum sp. YMD61]
MNVLSDTPTPAAARALLDTPPEDEFDNFTRLASRLMKVPVSLVSILDIDGNRQFFKSQFGLPDPWATTRQTPLSQSFCRLIVEDRQPLIVTDARKDARVRGNAVIDLLGVVAYLGVPVVADTGEVIGSFCVIDHEVRQWTDEDLDTLKRLGRSVNDQLRLKSMAQALETVRRDLANERDQLANILETVPVAVLSVNRQGRITLTNRECRRVLGLSEEEIAQRQFDDIRWQIEAVGGGPFQVEDLPVARVLRDGKPVRDVRHAVVWPDGERHILSINASPLTGPGGPVAVVCAVEDITERVAATQRIEEARQKAEDVSRAKSDFLANMSHEIRTPLNGVLGMAEVLQSMVTTPEKQRMVSTIRQSGETLLSVLNSILDMSKIEAGKLTLDKVPIRVPDLIFGIEALHRVKAEEKALDFEVLCSGGKSKARLGDPHRITQVLNNLLSNAIKFTESGDVRVIVSCKPGRPVMIEVTDTGIGMTEAQVLRVFESFEQAESSIARRYGGTGLGLSIVRQLVHLMGGTIEIESRHGSGTTVRVSLPLPEVDPIIETPQTPNAESDLACLAGKRVLVADDNPTNMMVLTEMLAPSGAQIVKAQNGEEVVTEWTAAQTEGRPFDLLLLDIRMPVKDGLTALKDIRSAEAKANLPEVPAIAVTANVMPQQVMEYVTGGFGTHLAKPILRADLMKAISVLLRVKA